MNRHEAPVDIQALLEHGRAIPRQPDSVRARILARARATAAAPLALAAMGPRPRPRIPHHLVAPAAGAALAVAAAGTVYALGGHWSQHAAIPTAAPSTAPVPRPEAALPSATSPSAVLAPAPSPAPPAAANTSSITPAEAPAPAHAVSRQSGQDAREAELRLMRSAHTAYAAHEYANALVLVGEHARRFPHGLLAEEREALRVRCLLGSGRTSEARRAEAAFALRFPRSVLLPRLEAEVGRNAE